MTAPTSRVSRPLGSPGKRPQVNVPPRRAGGRAAVHMARRNAGYIAQATCRGCRGQTPHLVLRRSLECKACLSVRARRDGDPDPRS